MRRLPPDRPPDAQINAIGRAVSSGKYLTRQLLTFARKQPLLLERVFLQERLLAMPDLLRPLLGSTTEIEIDVRPDAPLVEVDPAELDLAFINLAVNAGDAMQGCGRLSISARGAGPDDLGADKTGDLVVIDVDDIGPGADPAIASQVLEPLFTTKPVDQETGLGLSQVRAFCQSAGGNARLLAAPGGGAGLRGCGGSFRPACARAHSRPRWPRFRPCCIRVSCWWKITKTSRRPPHC